MLKAKKLNRSTIVWLIRVIILLSTFEHVYAAYTTNVNLGDASSFAILAGSTITNTGTTTISGTAGNNIGVNPGTTITEDAGPIILSSGTKYSLNEQIVQDSKSALNIAYTDILGRTATNNIVEELGGSTLVSGVYTSTGGFFGLTGTLTLNAENDPNAVFIFKMNSTLTTASGSNIVLINGADPCHIFWQVGSSATLGTNSTLMGHILASASITATSGALINGSLLAQTAAVTLDTNTIVNNSCNPTTATLVVIKNVVNDNSGSSIASDFAINVTSSGTDVLGSPVNGSATGTSYSLAPGTYVISEPAHSGYALSYSGDITSDGTVTLVAGETRTITLINNDIPPIAPTNATLVVIKNVINDNNGTSTPPNFSIRVTHNGINVTGSPANGSVIGTSYSLTPGTYVISEPTHSGYALSYSGDITSDGTVTLVAGETRTIRLTNNDIMIIISDASTPINEEDTPIVTPSIESNESTVQPRTSSSPLPLTTTNQLTLILMGGLIGMLGTVGWIIRKRIH